LISIKLIGKSELEVATILDRTMVDLGATGPAFETIVATGSNSAIPHHQPTDRLLAKGDLLKIDFGAQVGGYKSDCTRTFALGKPADWQEEIYRAVVEAQEIGRKTCVPDLDFGSLDNAVRQSISDSGYGDKFKHGLGHGVGLMIHEDPFLSAKSDGKIAQNMVITIEPGIYLPDLGGVRVEDTGLVTNAGYSVLTNFTYDLLELN
jgi:Xaa-Pro dipeptidase